MISELEVKERIDTLETQLRINETLFEAYTDVYTKRRITQLVFNIESQLQALYYVLGQEYTYKHL